MKNLCPIGLNCDDYGFDNYSNYCVNKIYCSNLAKPLYIPYSYKIIDENPPYGLLTIEAGVSRHHNDYNKLFAPAVPLIYEYEIIVEEQERYGKLTVKRDENASFLVPYSFTKEQAACGWGLPVTLPFLTDSLCYLITSTMRKDVISQIRDSTGLRFESENIKRKDANNGCYVFTCDWVCLRYSDFDEDYDENDFETGKAEFIFDSHLIFDDWRWAEFN